MFRNTFERQCIMPCYMGYAVDTFKKLEIPNLNSMVQCFQFLSL